MYAQEIQPEGLNQMLRLNRTNKVIMYYFHQVLQELCAYLGDASEGALFALHRLARAARSRSSERSTR